MRAGEGGRNFRGQGLMKSGSGGRPDDEEDGDDAFEPRHEVPRPPAKGEVPAGEFDDFDEEDFDDEFDDDFEEELEDEYELSEFEELTDDDLAEDEVADVTVLGDFVDEDAEPEEEPLVAEDEATEEAPEAGGKGKKKKGKAKAGKDEDEDIDD
jgi:hypothetical protein